MDISDSNLGTYLIVAMMAMAISMAIIPLMMRLAPFIGMIDAPDSPLLARPPARRPHRRFEVLRVSTSKW